MHTTNNHHLRGSGERNGAQRRTKDNHDAIITAAAVGKKARHRMKQCRAVKKAPPIIELKTK